MFTVSCLLDAWNGGALFVASSPTAVVAFKRGHYPAHSYGLRRFAVANTSARGCGF